MGGIDQETLALLELVFESIEHFIERNDKRSDFLGDSAGRKAGPLSARLDL
jgi:hypothetical protein